MLHLRKYNAKGNRFNEKENKNMENNKSIVSKEIIAKTVSKIAYHENSMFSLRNQAESLKKKAEAKHDEASAATKEAKEKVEQIVSRYKTLKYSWVKDACFSNEVNPNVPCMPDHLHTFSNVKPKDYLIWIVDAVIIFLMFFVFKSELRAWMVISIVTSLIAYKVIRKMQKKYKALSEEYAYYQVLLTAYKTATDMLTKATEHQHVVKLEMTTALAEANALMNRRSEHEEELNALYDLGYIPPSYRTRACANKLDYLFLNDLIDTVREGCLEYDRSEQIHSLTDSVQIMQMQLTGLGTQFRIYTEIEQEKLRAEQESLQMQQKLYDLEKERLAKLEKANMLQKDVLREQEKANTIQQNALREQERGNRAIEDQTRFMKDRAWKDDQDKQNEKANRK